ALWDGAGVVRLVSTAALVNDAKTEDDFPAAAHGPDGTLWVAYNSYTVRDESRRIEQPPLAKQPESFKGLYTPEFADQLWLKAYRGGKWGAPVAVTGPKESIARCAIGVEGNGDVWVVYSAFRKGRHDLFARKVTAKAGGPDLGPEIELPGKGRSNTNPVVCTKANGDLLIAYQYWRDDGQSGMGQIHGRGGKFDNDGVPVGSGVWTTSLAAAADGAVAAAFDTYEHNDYDISVRLTDKAGAAVHPVVASDYYEARPSCAF